MSSSVDLQFDKMEVDTKCAQLYLYNNSVVQSIGFDSIDIEDIFDAAGNRIDCLTMFTTKEHFIFKLKGIEDPTPTSHAWIELACQVEKKINLFCQLEYLIRKKPIQTTKLELTMVIKHLRYMAFINNYNKSPKDQYETLVMKNDSPLIDLGFIAELAPYVDIIATENTAVICNLFVKLCHSSGFPRITLALIKSVGDVACNVHELSRIKKRKVLQGRCIGIVTAQADVDSAVDAFLGAPMKGVCGIRRILVQESATERLKSAIAWKTRSGSPADVDLQLKSLSTDVYVYDDKTFLFEYVGSETVVRNVVLIESFRTVKELLSLTENYYPFCVSLWSSSVAESNEIALGITTPLVWVNDYGALGQPDFFALAYFSHLLPVNINGLSELDEMRKLQSAWSKLAEDQRYYMVESALAELDDNELNASFVKALYGARAHTSLTYFGAGDTVVAVPKPYEVYFLHCNSVKWRTGEIMKLLVKGSGCLINTEGCKSYESLIANLFEAGLPVRSCIITKKHSPNYKKFWLTEPVRIIQTNFSTVFAN